MHFREVFAETSSTIDPDTPPFHQQQAQFALRSMQQFRLLHARHGVYTSYPLIAGPNSMQLVPVPS